MTYGRLKLMGMPSSVADADHGRPPVSSERPMAHWAQRPWLLLPVLLIVTVPLIYLVTIHPGQVWEAFVRGQVGMLKHVECRMEQPMPTITIEVVERLFAARDRMRSGLTCAELLAIEKGE